MRKIIVLALLVTFLISVFVFSASADTIPVSGCYYIDAYTFCELLSDASGGCYDDVVEFHDRCYDYENSVSRLTIYNDFLGVGCIKYDGLLFFEAELVDLIVGDSLSPTIHTDLLIDGSVWVAPDGSVPYEIDFYSTDPWPDVAPFVSVVPSSSDNNHVFDVVSDSGIDSVLDYILVILPFAVGALVTYISVRKGYSYLRSVLNGS